MISAAGWPECTQVMQLQPNEEIKLRRALPASFLCGVYCFLQALFGQNCKIFLDIVAKRFWTLLHVQIGQSCNAPAGCVINQP